QPARLGHPRFRRSGRHRPTPRLLPQSRRVGQAVGPRRDVLHRGVPCRTPLGRGPQEAGVNAPVKLPSKPRDSFRLAMPVAFVGLFGWSWWSVDFARAGQPNRIKWTRLLEAPGDMYRLAKAMFRD